MKAVICGSIYNWQSMVVQLHFICSFSHCYIVRISKATVAKNAVAGEFSYSRASRCRRCLHRDVQGQGGQEVEVHLPDGGDQIALPKTVAAGVFCSNLSPIRKDFVFSEYNSICMGLWISSPHINFAAFFFTNLFVFFGVQSYGENCLSLNTMWNLFSRKMMQLSVEISFLPLDWYAFCNTSIRPKGMARTMIL